MKNNNNQILKWYNTNKIETQENRRINNKDQILKWYNTNKIVMQENNVDTFIFFG